MAKNHFLAGVGTALLFRNNNLIAVAKTLTEDTFDFSVSNEEIRAGSGNSLWGRYFHDSNLTVSMVDAMFKLDYIALSLGVDISEGGVSLKEESLVTSSNTVTVTETPTAFNGSAIGWYKLPTESDWHIGTFANKVMTITGGGTGTTYCVKYFYQNEDAESIIIPTNYIPSELHVVIINDLYAGDVADQDNATKYGRLITDIPRLQLDGAQNLSLTSTSAATISLSGSALATEGSTSCDSEAYYGTMTEEIFGETWESKVVALASENSEIALASTGGVTETITMRVVYGGNIASQRKDNSNFTFTVESGSSSIIGCTSAGVVSAKTTGTGYVAVTLTNNTSVEPCIIKVVVS